MGGGAIQHTEMTSYTIESPNGWAALIQTGRTRWLAETVLSGKRERSYFGTETQALEWADKKLT